jgi:hypothetical protein
MHVHMQFVSILNNRRFVGISILLTLWVFPLPLLRKLYVCLVLQVRSVKVTNVSLTATVQDIKEFFSFSGDIEHVEMQRFVKLEETTIPIFHVKIIL